jgi:acetyl/propionyl-CoA carboxylase alpha subunit
MVETDILVIRRVLIAEQGPLTEYLVRSLSQLGLETVVIVPNPPNPVSYAKHATFAVQLSSAKTDFKDALIEIANDAGCDGIHPGYSGLAEDIDFAQRVMSSNVKFIGPQLELVFALSDRWTVREMARAAGIPVSEAFGPISSVSEVSTCGDVLGFPLWVKDGAGRAPRLVQDREQLAAEVASRSMSGASAVWGERHIPKGRHVVASCVWEEEGDMVLSLRDRALRDEWGLSVDLVPAPVSEEVGNIIRDSALRFGRALGYRGIGSVGFMVDEDEAVVCIGFRSRLQVGDLLSDSYQGLNLAELQLRLAFGESIGWSSEELQPKGCSIAIRIHAVGHGIVKSINVPDMARFETNLVEGHYASGLLGVLIVSSDTRQAAVVKAVASLNELVIEGVDNDIQSHIDAIANFGFWSDERLN